MNDVAGSVANDAPEPASGRVRVFFLPFGSDGFIGVLRQRRAGFAPCGAGLFDRFQSGCSRRWAVIYQQASDEGDFVFPGAGKLTLEPYVLVRF
jgi:hypothetical protein